VRQFTRNSMVMPVMKLGDVLSGQPCWQQLVIFYKIFSSSRRQGGRPTGKYLDLMLRQARVG